jgi:hypothetical protein
MFKRLFQKQHSGKPSKIDYWKKWELFELFDDLHKAESLLSDIATVKHQDDILKFKSEFVEKLYETEGDNVTDLTRIWEWFAPAKEWDTLIGEIDKGLGNNIFRITDNWKRNQDFLNGTKVSLHDEFGVVLDKTAGNSMYGLIRWDTNKESDIEDWRGLFGSFLEAGGQVIHQDYEFKFINDDGSTKKAGS